jgi:CxxC motif-containing protein (DUF1111 family)
LPRPLEDLPADTADRARAERGKAVFAEVGCAACHVPSMGGVEGLYTDFLLHKLEDTTVRRDYASFEDIEAPLPFEHPRPDEWKTPPLWGVADSAPYFHDGASPTLEAAIKRHGVHAKTVRAGYEKLSALDQAALISFLKTLKAPHEAEPVAPAAQSVASSR